MNQVGSGCQTCLSDQALNLSECRLLPAGAGYKSELSDCGYGNSQYPWGDSKGVEAKGREVLSHFHEIGQLTSKVEEALQNEWSNEPRTGFDYFAMEHWEQSVSAVKKQTTWSPLPHEKGGP